MSSTLLRPLAAGLAALAAAALAPAARATEPLTLDRALELAARRNADLLSAGADLGAAQADRAAARAALLPRLDLSAAVGREAWGAGVTTSAGFSSAYPAGNSGAHVLQLQASQPLLDLSRARTLEQSRLAERAAARQADEVALAVSYAVTQRFYEVVKQERSLTVLEQAAARTAELVDRADALYAAGRSPRSDTFSARVNLQNDRIAVEAQQARLARARSALAVTLGLEDPAELAVAAPPELDAPPPAAEPPPLAELQALARERRPTAAADAARVEAARVAVGVARAGDWPSLSLQGTYARESTRLTGQDGVYGDPSRTYTATGQVVLSWNLFQGLGTRADVARAEARLAGAQASAQRGTETVAQEVADARAAVVSLARQERLAAENLQLARDSLRLATERFAAGLASQLEERDASLKLSQAELTLLEARVDHTVARADLARAVGGGR